ncbi:protein kinase domain-containing protein [Zavarzinella formosa]|uniref:protein kinase domain-containing protein n=1 Tax=Zavarzinella formosa TaxID=360055 RepID=UPI0003643D32|nr:protein kinase [Zavarzinella formosa]
MPVSSSSSHDSDEVKEEKIAANPPIGSPAAGGHPLNPDGPTEDYSNASLQTPGGNADLFPAGEPNPSADLIAAFGDRYEVGTQLGEGGFGAVFRALDRRLNRSVAIKISRSASSDPDKLLREARSLAQLRHPGIVAVYDVSVSGQSCFVVSELLPGPSLANWLKEHRPSATEAVQIVAAVADSLGHAHSLSIVHRDIKPANIVFADGQRPVLVDFGLALSDMDAAAELGVISGTPAYMSPEQTGGRAHRPDGRTDIYSLAATLYAMLCGRAPFRGRNHADIFRQVREDEPQPPRQIRPDLPLELERVCLRGMAKLPGDRYTTANDFAEALRRSVGLLSPLPLFSEPAPRNAIEAVAPVPVPPPIPRKVSRTERRQITLLQCLCEADNGDDDPMEQVAAFQTLCDDVVKAHGGLPMQASGSAFLACFGYPVAREDAPRQAVRAALAILRRTTAVPAIAVGTGSAVVTENPSTPPVVVGDVVAITSALIAKESSSGVTVSDTTFRLVDGYFDCEPNGEVRPRGLSPVSAHRVRAERAARNRIDATDPARLSPLVGRDREVALLKERWELTAEGVQNVILLVADPGLGKSRLVRVLREHVLHGSEVTASDTARSEAGGAIVIEWFCSPYHLASPFYPVIDYFDRIYHLNREPDAGRRLDLLVTRLRVDGVRDAEDMALFAAMLSVPAGDRLPALALTPERQRDKTREAILNWLVARAERSPVLFVVEDLHWVDPSSQTLLTQFVERGGEASVLAVFTFRPEYDPPWKGKAVQTQVALNRLTRGQVAEMVRAQSGDRVIPQVVIDQIAERTDGVPLFVEEFTRLVAERGGAIGVGADIPTTLHDLLLARLDRMASDKTVVQLGAVIGRTFSHSVIQAASDLDESELREELDKLVGAGLVFAKGTPPRCSYTFKHALIQDAAYLSMVKKRRQQFHQTVAEKLEERFPETVEKQPELIAHHLTEAGQSARAIYYWLKAGQRAQDAFANSEAFRHLTRGLELLVAMTDLPEKDRTELEFQLRIAEVLIQQKGYAAAEVSVNLERAKALAEQVGEPASLFFTLRGRWGWRLLRSDLVEAIRQAGEFQKFTLARCAPEYHFEADFALGCTHYYRGEFKLALDHSISGVNAYQPDASPAIALRTGHDSGVINQVYWALSLWHLGYPEQAMVQGRITIERAIERRHQFTLAHAYNHVGWLAHFCGLGRATREAADTALRISDEQGFGFWSAIATMTRGAALILEGECERGIEDVRRGMFHTRASGARLLDTLYATFLADGLLRLGQLDEALATVDTGIAQAGETTTRFVEPELHRIRGEILLAATPPDRGAARDCFLRSLALAGQQGSRAAELRAAISLHRLLRGGPEAAESRARLAGIFGRHIEGFGLPDLVAARLLLDE